MLELQDGGDFRLHTCFLCIRIRLVNYLQLHVAER